MFLPPPARGSGYTAGSLYLTISFILMPRSPLKRTGRWKVDKEGREQFVRLLARTILNPYEVWYVPASVSGRKRTVLRLLRIFRAGSGDVGGFACFQPGGRRVAVRLSAFAPKTGNPLRMLTAGKLNLSVIQSESKYAKEPADRVASLSLAVIAAKLRKLADSCEGQSISCP